MQSDASTPPSTEIRLYSVRLLFLVAFSRVSESSSRIEESQHGICEVDFRAKMHVFANSAAERASAGPKAAAEAGLLGVVQLSRVVERCHNVPLRRGMDRQLVATTPRADTTGSRALSSKLVGGQNVLQSTLQYGYEHFLEQVNLAEQLTSSDFGISTGLITQNYWENSKWYYVNVERGNAADKLNGRNINVSFTNNSDVPVEVMVFIFYSDEIAIDVKTGLVTRHKN